MHIINMATKPSTTLLLLVLTTTCLFTSPSPALLAEKCNPQDKAALLRIKNELGNPSGLSSWNASTDCCDYHKWIGVLCDTDTQTYRVNILSITDLVLPKPSPIPPSIGDLPFLNNLRFDKINNLTGPISTSIRNLTKLHYIYITHTNVTGVIPDFFSTVKTLVTLDFSYNSLSGSLPGSLSSLPNLGGITLDGNLLSGEIPASYGSFSSKFTSISASRNRLSGKLPATLAALNLAFVDLSRNALEGDASMLFGAAKNTQKIILARNNFAFDFGKVGLSSELNTIDVRNNRIYGTLPEGLNQLKSLKKLNVSYNSLCGEIPHGGKMNWFDEYSYAHNKCLCGTPLPSCNKTNRA